MSIRSRSKGPWRLIALCLLWILMASCGSKDKYVGAYKAEANGSSKLAETVLELKENGQGVWKVGDEEVSVSWDVKGDELRVNTRSGGVIVGSFHGEVVDIALPNSRMMSFKKIQ